MTNIFLSNGRINGDIDPATIPEARRAQFIALVSAQHGCERAESEEKIANDAVAQRYSSMTARTRLCLVVRSWGAGNGWSVSNKKTAPPL